MNNSAHHSAGVQNQGSASCLILFSPAGNTFFTLCHFKRINYLWTWADRASGRNSLPAQLDYGRQGQGQGQILLRSCVIVYSNCRYPTWNIYTQQLQTALPSCLQVSSPATRGSVRHINVTDTHVTGLKKSSLLPDNTELLPLSVMKLFIVHNTTLCVFHPKWGWRAAGLISAKDPEVTYAPWAGGGGGREGGAGATMYLAAAVCLISELCKYSAWCVDEVMGSNKDCKPLAGIIIQAFRGSNYYSCCTTRGSTRV